MLVSRVRGIPYPLKIGHLCQSRLQSDAVQGQRGARFVIGVQGSKQRINLFTCVSDFIQYRPTLSCASVEILYTVRYPLKKHFVDYCGFYGAPVSGCTYV